MSKAATDERGLILTCPSCGRKNRLVYEKLAETFRCGNCKTELSAGASPLDIDSTDDFDRLIGSSPIPVVVDYWAPWCGPCRMVAPELVKVAARANGRFLIVKVNTDVLSDLGQRFGIRSIPTMAVYSRGREIKRTTGARPAAEIEAFITG